MLHQTWRWYYAHLDALGSAERHQLRWQLQVAWSGADQGEDAGQRRQELWESLTDQPDGGTRPDTDLATLEAFGLVRRAPDLPPDPS